MGIEEASSRPRHHIGVLWKTLHERFKSVEGPGEGYSGIAETARVQGRPGRYFRAKFIRETHAATVVNPVFAVHLQGKARRLEGGPVAESGAAILVQAALPIVSRAALRYVEAEGGSNTEGEATRSLDRVSVFIGLEAGSASGSSKLKGREADAAVPGVSEDPDVA